jgi:hypothetical protein
MYTPVQEIERNVRTDPDRRQRRWEQMQAAKDVDIVEQRFEEKKLRNVAGVKKRIGRPRKMSTSSNEMEGTAKHQIAVRLCSRILLDEGGCPIQ